MPVTVLVVDDSALMRKALRAMLVDAGFVVRTARNGLDALDQVRQDPPDVVTLDVNMPEMDGMTCLAQLMTDHPLPVVMVSSLTDAAAQLTFEALELGAVDFVTTPGGTVSLDIDLVRHELVAKVGSAATARIRRAGGLRERLRRQREQAERAERSSSAQPDVREVGSASRAGQPARPARRVATLVPEVVLVGASTGGPAALSTLLAGLPRDFFPPVVIAQHIPASFTRHLAARLDADCPLAVCEVAGIEVLRPGTVYLGRGDADVVLAPRAEGLAARSVPASGDYRWHPSVDRLVASALAYCTDARRVVGVLLTGMGDDGAAELTRLRELGGRTIAESQETAVVFGMCGDLVKRGGASKVLPLEQIAPQLVRWT